MAATLSPPPVGLENSEDLLESLLSERDCWHCEIKKELCLSVVVLGGQQMPGRLRDGARLPDSACSL